MADGTLLGENQPDPPTLWDGDQWEEAVACADLDPSITITPFEAKALYTIGMMRHLNQGAMRCLGEQGAGAPESLELPAYVLVADSIEALGRCLLGCRCTNGKGQCNRTHKIDRRMKAGLETLQSQDATFPGSGGKTYQARACINLRHFAVHGAAVLSGESKLDRELTGGLLDRFGEQLTVYWQDLGDDTQNQGRRKTLARARVLPLFTRKEDARTTIFIADMHKFIQDGSTAGHGIHGPEQTNGCSNATQEATGG